MIRFAPLALLALLAACEKPAADNVVAPLAASNTVGADGIDYLAKIAALPKGQQQLVLYRAILDAKLECANITKAERLPDSNGRAAWQATCRGGLIYSVTIGRNGVANVTGPFAAK